MLVLNADVRYYILNWYFGLYQVMRTGKRLSKIGNHPF